MTNVLIEPNVSVKMPDLQVNQETLAAMRDFLKLPNDETAASIHITESAKRKFPIGGVGRYMFCGHPMGGFKGRENTIEVYRKGAPTPDIMAQSIIRGLTANSVELGTDYEQRDAAKRVQTKWLSIGALGTAALSGAALGLDALLTHQSPPADGFIVGELAIFLGGLKGLSHGMDVASDKYPQAGGIGSLGYYIAQGRGERAFEHYEETFAESAPLVTAQEAEAV